MNDYEMMSPEKVAEAYGGDKRRIAQAAKMGILNPTVAVMAGMFIDRMRGAAANENQPKSTVAEDVMQPPVQGAIPQQAGLDSLPVSDDMVPDYAGGGIVAFADGGDIPAYKTGDYIPGGRSTNPYADLIYRQALAMGEDPERALEIFERETGNIKDAETALSPKGARGLMQVMPSTAAKPGFGVPNIFTLAKERGIDVPDTSLKTADELLKNPELNADFGIRYRSALEKRTGDPVLAAAAYNAGPGAVERAGGVPNIAETKKYVAGISPQRFEAASKNVRAGWRDQLGLKPEKPSQEELRAQADANRQLVSDIVYGRQPVPTPDQLPKKPRGSDSREIISDMVYGRTPIPVRGESPGLMAENTPQAIVAQQKLDEAAAVAKIPTDTQDKPKGESYGDKLERLLTEREGRISSQREQDKNLALLAAGLGIMGGTSPYAMQNIGAGALKGVEQYGSARKLTRQEEEDILAARLGQYRYGEESRIRSEDKRLNQGMTLASMEEKRIRDSFSKILGDVLDPRNAQLKELLKKDPDYVERMAIQGRNRILKGYGLEFGEQELPGATIAKDYSKWGKLNVNKS